jgi:transaldolase/glucose-6-phosphate isomerase
MEPQNDSGLQLSLGPLERHFDARMEAWRRQQFAERLWAKDPGLWSPEDVPELEDRLGWLDLPHAMEAVLEALEELASGLRRDRIREVVVLGMGGSSLAPEVFQRTFGSASEHPNLTILDTTHPDAVGALARSLAVLDTAFLVSSKSGTTIETLSLLDYFWQWAGEADPEPGSRFMAITDGGSPLAELGTGRRFRALLEAPSDLGGRYSALSHFGLAPAAILGIDLRRLLASAREMADRCAPDTAVDENPGLRLGAALAEAALAGRDKLTFLTDPSLESFPDWIEQLVAESTGKEGRGLVPIVGEPGLEVSAYGDDRFFVEIALAGCEAGSAGERSEALAAAGYPVARIVLRDHYDLGAEIFRWELAVAAVGAALGIQPFDQPDVQLAKQLARRAMQAPAGPETPTEEQAVVSAEDPAALSRAVGEWLASCRAGDYIAVQAFLMPNGDVRRALGSLRNRLTARTGCAATLGLGPRFLHSTGQLHKGGPDRGRFLQLIDQPRTDIPIPGAEVGFARLIGAQAEGDAAALMQRGRRLLRIDLGRDVGSALGRLETAIG